MRQPFRGPVLRNRRPLTARRHGGAFGHCAGTRVGVAVRSLIDGTQITNGRRSTAVFQTITGLAAGLTATQGQKGNQKGSGEKSCNHIGHSHAPQVAGVGRRGASMCLWGNERPALVLIVTIFSFAAIARSIDMSDLSGDLRSPGAWPVTGRSGQSPATK